MAWIESHQELARHPKTKKFARLLGVSLPAAVGHLHFFWWWAMDYAQDGDISRYDMEEVADACGWEGEPKKLFHALLDAGFTEGDDGDYHIHDWREYAGRLIEKREQNKERKKRSRARHAPVTQESQEKSSDDRESHRATEPNQTIPNQTKPKTKEKNLFSDYTSNGELVKTLESFVENRKKIKKPMTDRAVTLLLGELDKLASSDQEKIAILEQSIFNGWQGVFALKDKGVVNGAANRRNSENPNAGINFGF